MGTHTVHLRTTGSRLHTLHRIWGTAPSIPHLRTG